MREPFRKFRLIVNVLLISEAILGLTILFVTAVYQYILESFMIQEQRELLSSKFLICYLLAFQMFAIYSCSLFMWKSIWSRRYSTSIRLLLLIWLFFCFVIVLCGGATVWFMFTSTDALTENVAMTLFRGIDSYYINPEWKLLWDQLQYSRKCCGVNKYLDWMNATWMPQLVVAPRNPNYDKYEDYENEIVESLHNLRRQSGRNGSPECLHVSEKPLSQKDHFDTFQIGREQTLAPYACCRHDSSECYQSYLPSSDTSAGIPQLNLLEIYTEGCLPLFSQYISLFANLLLVLVLTAILVKICICCLTNYLLMKTDRNCYRELDGNVSYFDDDGNALVVIKCPPKVRCITLEEQDNTWDSDLPYNICSDAEPCICCGDYDRVINPDNHSKLAQTHRQVGRRDILLH